MKWKQFAKMAFAGILVVALATVVLLSFADIETTNWFGGFVWWLIGLVILMVVGFIIWATGVVVVQFIQDVWDRLTKTKKQRDEEREEKESRRKFLDDLRKRGLLR